MRKKIGKIRFGPNSKDPVDRPTGGFGKLFFPFGNIANYPDV